MRARDLVSFLRRRPDELDFAGDPATGFLPGVVALMVFLTALALIGALLLDRAIVDWRRSLTARVTIEVPAGPQVGERATAAEAVLRATPGLTQVRILPDEEVAALLKPWLGEGAQRLDLPLPRLIDATVEEGAAPDISELRKKLGDAAPGVAVDDHRDWLGPLVAFARGLEGLALVVILLVGGAAMAAIAYAVRSGLAIHAGVVEFLHLIGAEDGYISQQFERQIVILGMRGAAFGVLGVGLISVPLALLAMSLESPVLRAPGLEAWHLALVSLVPVAAVALAGAVARMILRRALARMP